MTVDVELFDDLDAVARDAGTALDRDSQASLFDRLDWFRLTSTHCAPAGTPLIVRARGEDAAAWLFLMRAGGSATALASWYSLRFDVVAHPDAPAASLTFSIAANLRALRPRLSTVSLTPLPDSSPLPMALREAGWIVRTVPATINWHVKTHGLGFADYWAMRPGQLRSTAKRKAKAAKLDIRIARDFDEALWNAYWEVYRASWKPEEGAPAFLDALVRREGAAGTLRLGVAFRDGAPVAAQLWLVENGVATIHKLAYVAAERALSPGTVLSEAMFRHVIERDRPWSIDFGTGDDGYKADWMEERRTLLRLDAWNPATLPGLAGAGRAAASALVRRSGSH